MKTRCLFALLLSITLVSSVFGEDVDSRLKALEDRSAGQEKKIEEQQKTIDSLKGEIAKSTERESRQESNVPATRATRTDLLSRQAGGGRLRLLDLSMDALFGAGTSTEDDESLQTLQGGGHDPRKRGFTVQNIELSLTGAVDPYLTGEAHLVFFLDPLSGETHVELEETFLTTTSLSHGLQLEAGHFFTEFGRLNPRHPHPFRDDRHRISPLISWQPSEFSRLRFQYNFDRADHLPDKEAHSVWLGVEFMYGAHPAHTY